MCTEHETQLVIGLVVPTSDVAQKLARQLAELGTLPRTFASVQEALDGGCKLVFAEWNLQDSNLLGAALRANSERSTPLAVVVLVPKSADYLIRRATAYGATHVLEIPPEEIDIREQVEALRRAEQPPLDNAIFRHLRSTSLVGKSAAFRKCIQELLVIAPSTSTVLLLGESGTGKEMFAQAIHALGEHATSPFHALNIAALPEHLIESEMFGYMKGAFTGAIADKIGHFESAGDGTVLLDEIGELALVVQAKLLRVLETKTFYRLGSSEPVALKARVIAATNKPLTELASRRSFRQDLYYRLSESHIEIPSLSERREDIVLLAKRLLEKFSEEEGLVEKMQFSLIALHLLESYSYPGNVRELENIVKYALDHCRPGARILSGHLPREVFEQQPVVIRQPRDTVLVNTSLPYKEARTTAFRDVDKILLDHLLAKHNGSIPRVLEETGMDRKTYNSRSALAKLSAPSD